MTEKQNWDVPSNVVEGKASAADSLALKHGISPERAQMLIDRLGADSTRLNEEAAKISQAHAR